MHPTGMHSCYYIISELEVFLATIPLGTFHDSLNSAKTQIDLSQKCNYFAKSYSVLFGGEKIEHKEISVFCFSRTSGKSVTSFDYYRCRILACTKFHF